MKLPVSRFIIGILRPYIGIEGQRLELIRLVFGIEQHPMVVIRRGGEAAATGLAAAKVSSLMSEFAHYPAPQHLATSFLPSNLRAQEWRDDQGRMMRQYQPSRSSPSASRQRT